MTVLEMFGLLSLTAVAALIVWGAVLAAGDWIERRRGLGRIERYANGGLTDRLRQQEDDRG